MRIGFSLTLFILLTAFSANAAKNSSTYSLTPDFLKAEIEQSGPKVVVNNLYRDFHTWENLMVRISSGEPEWLKIAVLLYSGSDAGTASMLRESVGLALVTNPESVLQIAAPTYGVGFICGGRADPLPTYEQALAELQAQIRSVEAVQDPQLIELRDKCLGNLHEAKPHLQRFFGIN